MYMYVCARAYECLHLSLSLSLSLSLCDMALVPTFGAIEWRR
jgi:hypothetical protein